MSKKSATYKEQESSLSFRYAKRLRGHKIWVLADKCRGIVCYRTKRKDTYEKKLIKDQ